LDVTNSEGKEKEETCSMVKDWAKSTEIKLKYNKGKQTKIFFID